MSTTRRGDGTAAAEVTSTDLLADPPFAGDLDKDLQPKPQRLRPPGTTVYLTAGILAVGGFLGGVQSHKVWGSDAAGGSAPTGAMPQGGQGRTGGFGGNAAAAGATTGTVTKVAGGYIYLKTTDGRTVKIKTSGSTKITLSENGKVGDLKSGSTVVVQGQTGSDGTLSATAVTEGSGTGGMGGPPGNTPQNGS